MWTIGMKSANCQSKDISRRYAERDVRVEELQLGKQFLADNGGKRYDLRKT